MNGHAKRSATSAAAVSALAISPFGSRLAGDGQHLEADPGEKETLAEIATLRKKGVSMRQIAAALNQRAYRTRRGTPWRLESIARVLNTGSIRDSLLSSSRPGNGIIRIVSLTIL